MAVPVEQRIEREEPFRLWPALREAVRGSQQDFTAGPIGRALLLLAVPMVLETVMESVFAVVDVFFVSRLGVEAVATVGLTAAAGFVVGSVIMGGYLWLSSLFGTLLDESYSSLRIQDWKSFIRIRVSADGGLKIFPVGLRKVARSWRRVAGDGGEPRLQPEDEVTPPTLIEVPLELGRR